MEPKGKGGLTRRAARLTLTPMSITIDELQEQIKKAKEDPTLPAWVGLLLSMVWVMMKGLNDQLIQVQADYARLHALHYGRKKSERGPSPSAKPTSEQKTPKPRDPERSTLETTALPEETKEHAAPTSCPKCGGEDLKELSSSEEQIEYVMRPASLIRVRHKLKKCACAKGCTVLTAPAPPRVGEGGTMFGPSVYAHIIASRVFDALPFSRQADRWSRAGIPLRKSTICDLFHRGTQELQGVYLELLRAVSASPLLHADETPQPFTAEGATRCGYMWVFADKQLSAFVFSKTRSGDVPKVLLSGTPGNLVVDGYTGYNAVSTPESRTRVGCHAHARRKFHEALSVDQEVSPQALRIIRDLYAIEYEVKERGEQGTPAHLAARQELSKPLMAQLRALVDAHLPTALPKSMLGKALTYADRQWASLIRFVDDASLPLDNNHAERLLRRVALARKTSLFMGPERGESYAVAYSLVQSCRLCGVNPELYLADVLLRVQSTPASLVRELLPDRWRPPDGGAAVGWV